MANAGGFMQESMWRDPDWRALSRSAQCTFQQIVSQKEIDCAGVIPLMVSKWAKGCDEITEEDVWADLAELQEKRFFFYDTETDEGFARSYIRRSNVIKSPNLMKSALRCALLVASETIRVELAEELRKTRRSDAAAAAEQLNPSETVSEGFDNPSETVNGFGRVPEPPGVGVGVGAQVTLGISQGGEPPRCPDHPENSNDPCRRCQKRREWEEANADAIAAAKAEAKRQRTAAIQNCKRCEGTHWVIGTEDDPEGPTKCDHRQDLPPLSVVRGGRHA